MFMRERRKIGEMFVRRETQLRNGGAGTGKNA